MATAHLHSGGSVRESHPVSYSPFLGTCSMDIHIFHSEFSSFAKACQAFWSWAEAANTIIQGFGHNTSAHVRIGTFKDKRVSDSY